MSNSLEPESGSATRSFLSTPGTSAGRWAARMLAVVFGILVVSSILSGAFGRGDHGVVTDVLRVAGPLIGISFAVSGISALVLSLRALIIGRERSILVWCALLFGIFTLVFMAGEVFLPH